MSNLDSHNKRIGTFAIKADDIRARAPYIFSIFNNMIIIRAEMMYYDNSVHYVGLCDDFEEIQYGAKPIEYTFEVVSEDNSVIWVKQ